MPQNDLILNEEHRSKLDNIVNQMQTNGESDDDIQFVVDDFKTKYGTSPKQSAPSQGAGSGFQGNAPLAKPSIYSDYTGKPTSISTSPSASTSSVGVKSSNLKKRDIFDTEGVELEKPVNAPKSGEININWMNAQLTPENKKGLSSNQKQTLNSLAFNKKEAIRKAQEAPHEAVPLDAEQRYEHINLLEQRKNAVNSLYSATEKIAQSQYKDVQNLSNKLNEASAKIDELAKSGNRQAAIELQAQVKPLLDEYNAKSYQLKKSGYKLESLKNRLAETDKQMIDISEGQGGVTNQWQALNSGINQLTASILRTPQTVYNTILAGQNKLAEATGLPISAPYQTEGYLESAAKYFDKNADAYNKVIEKKKAQDNYDIISLAKRGDYAKAINLLSENIVESAPITGGLAMASATGVGAIPLFLGGTSVFAAQNFEENKDKGISVEKNLLNSWANATLEQIFEETGTLAIVRYGKDLFTKAGKAGVEEAAKNVWEKAYGYALKKLFPVGAAGAEGLSEAETTFTQNYVNTIMGMNDEFNAKLKQIQESNLSQNEKEDFEQELYKQTLFKGVPDAFITGAGMGTVLGAGTKEGYTAIDDKKREELKKAQKKYDNLATTLSDPTVSKEAKSVIKEQADLEANKIQQIAEADDLEHAEKLTPKQYTNVISVQAEIDKLENSLQSVTNTDAKAVLEAKIEDLTAKKNSILGIQKPIKYTSSTNDRYGYVEENGVKRDLTKQEFEDYGKVDMEQSMEAAPTEESKRVGEDTEAFTTDAKFKSEPIELSIEPSRVEEPTKAPTTETKPTPSEESKAKEVEAKIEELKRKKQEELDSVDIAKGGKIPIEGYKDFYEKVNAKYDKLIDAELAKLKTDETEATKNKEASVPSKPSASGEDTSKGEQQKAEVVDGKVGVGRDVESRTNKLESKLPEFENNTRGQSTKDLIAWAEDIFDTKFEGDFNKGEYVSFFNSLGDKGYEAARFLQNPKKALSILKESPTYLAKVKEQSPKETPQAKVVDGNKAIEEVLRVKLNKGEKESAKYNGSKEEDVVPTRAIFKKKLNQEVSDWFGNTDEEELEEGATDVRVEMVNINDITPTQLLVNKSKIESREDRSVLPVLAKTEDGLFVVDGHHRISSEILSGKTNVEAKIIDLTNNFESEWLDESEAPQAEVVEPTEGSRVELPNDFKNGLPKKMVFSQGEWKQEIGNELGKVGEKQQEEANNKFKELNTVQGVNKVKSELKSNESKASNENENYIRPVMNEEAKPNINTGIEILPSERANEAESNLVIVQSKKYYTLWLKIPSKNNNRIQYTYLTTLSTNLDEARAKANDYIQKLKEGQKLSVAFNGKNMADIGDRKSIALREDVMMEKDLDKRNVSMKSVASLPLGLDTKLGFGKYANSTIGEIIENDSSYASWLAENAQRQDIRDLIKSHPTFQQIEDIRELERERVKAFEEREKRREEGENVSVVTLVRGEGNKIVEKNEDTAPIVKNVEKKENRVVKDQIKDIIPPNTRANDNVRDELKPKMFQSQIDGANTAIQSMNDNGVVLNGDGAGVGKTRQIIAVADHFAKKGKVVVIISENAAIGKPFEKVGAYKLGGSMEKDSQEMGVKINLLEGGVEEGNIYISTYNRIKDSDIPKGAIVIFDESQNLANTFGRSPDANNKEEKQWETKFKSILNKADATAYYSATPADKPHQLAYLHKILGFETPEAFLAAAVENGTQIKTRKFGREEIKYYDVPSSAIKRKKLYDWVNGLMVKAGENGIFIKREISYEGTDVQFHDVKGTNESVNKFAGLFNDVIQQMSLAERNGYRLLAPNSYILYAAELAKIGEAVKMAKREKAAGRKVIIFVSRIKEMEIRGKRKEMGGTWSEPIVVGKIPSPVEILRKELEKDGITFVELHGSSKMSSQKAQKEFNEKADALVASLESGGTGINLDDTKGDSPRTEIFMFSPYRGISTIQGMGRIWRASTIQNDNKPNRYVFITTSDIAPDIARSGVLAKKLQLMNAAIGGTAVSKLPMSKVNYDVKQLVGIELPDEGEESAINKDKTGILKPVEIEFKKSAKGNLFAEANADLLEWVERGGVERTGLNIKIFKGDNGKWIALSDKQYTPEEYAPEGINEGVSLLETKELNTKEDAIQESKAEGVLSREQGKVGEAGSEREGVGQGEQGQEPTKASKEEVTPQAGSVVVVDVELPNYGKTVDTKMGKVDLVIEPNTESGNKNSIKVSAYDADGNTLGFSSAVIDAKNKTLTVKVSQIKDKYQRNGIYSKMIDEYEAIAKNKGLKLEREVEGETKASKDFWNNREKEGAVQNKINEIAKKFKSVESELKGTIDVEEFSTRLKKRYDEINEQYGEDKANEVLDSEAKRADKIIKEHRDSIAQRLKAEYFKKNGNAPSSIRDFKSGIKSGEYKIDDLPSYKDAVNAGLELPKAVEQSLKETTKAAKTVEQLRAEEQAELDTKIPNAEKYRVDGKVERSKLTNDADRKAFDEVYDKYDKLITDVSKKETPKAEQKVEPTPEKVQESKVDLSLFKDVADKLYSLKKEPLTAKEKETIKQEVVKQPLEVRQSIDKAKKIMDELEKKGLITTIKCK